MTDDIARLTARIDDLEMRAAEQERTIEDLNATVMAQWKEIEELKRETARLGAQVQEMEAHAPSGEPEPPPPHYGAVPAGLDCGNRPCSKPLTPIRVRTAAARLARPPSSRSARTSPCSPKPNV